MSKQKEKEINNEKVLEAFEVISKDSSFNECLGHSIALLVHVFDSAERKYPNKLKRIETVVGLDWITPKYRLILEEIVLEKKK